MRRAPLAALLAAVPLVACTAEQSWVFTNGVGVPEGPPARIVAEVFEGPECGFECRPSGLRRYCHELVRGARGPAPDGLEAGARYCFMGTALDDDGEAFAVGCAIAEAGAEDVAITLSAIEEGRFIARQCGTRPVITLDAGPAFDAGAPPDAGPRDAGPRDAGPDAGPPRTDAGLPQGTSVSVVFDVVGDGTLTITDRIDGGPVGPQPLTEPVLLTVDAFVGFPVRMQAVPSAGRTFVRFEGSPCGTTTPCDFTFDRSETVRAIFQ